MKKYILIAVTFIVLMYVGLKSNSVCLFSLKNHVCVTDEFLSDNHAATISQYISDDAHKHLSVHALMCAVKKEFSVIKKIVIHFRPLVAQVKLEAHEPMCSINDLFVLTSNNQLLSKAVFSPEVIEVIPAISVNMHAFNNDARSLVSFFNALPADVNNFYNLDFINQYCIRLIDKNNPYFVIVLAGEQKNYPLLLTRCEAIKNNLSARGSFDRGMEWIADARFAHYIVAYKA